MWSDKNVMKFETQGPSYKFYQEGNQNMLALQYT